MKKSIWVILLTGLFVFGYAIASNATLWTDDFDDGDYTNDLTWVVDNGGFEVVDGTLKESAKGNNYPNTIYPINDSASIYTVLEENVTSFQVDYVNPPQGLRGEHCLSFWITDDASKDLTNGYQVSLWLDSMDWGSPTDYMSLFRIDDGVWTAISSGSTSPVPRDSSQHTIKLTVDNGEIWAELDGILMCLAMDATYSEFDRVTINSYMKYYSIDAELDNVIITTSDPVPEPTTIFLFGTGLVGMVSARKRLKK